MLMLALLSWAGATIRTGAAVAPGMPWPGPTSCTRPASAVAHPGCSEPAACLSAQGAVVDGRYP